MKKTVVAVVSVIVGVFLLALPEYSQAQTKENFEQNRKSKGFFGRLFSLSGSKQARPVNYRKHMDNQREQAESEWQQRRDFRAEKRKKQLNRKPTAWELAYSKEERKSQRQGRKVLREREKTLEARAKSKSKAMASMVRYNKKKAKRKPAEQNTFGPDHFGFTTAAGSPAVSRRR